MEHAALTGMDLIFPGAAVMMPALPPTASRRRQAVSRFRREHNRQEEVFRGCHPGVSVMNNWVLASLLVAAAAFMYFAIIIKMSE